MNIHQIKTPHLSLLERQALLMSMTSVLAGLGDVFVSLTYNKQTETRPRIAGKDYVAMPGVRHEAQIGKLVVCQYVDNPANRRLNRVGKFYLKVETMTRADGTTPHGYANMRPEGITAFALTGFVPSPNPGQTTPGQG